MVALESLVALCHAAGRAAMEHYGSSDGVRLKADRTPLTRADQASHDCLVAGLAELDPGTPVVSEEGDLPSVDERQGWTRFWLVDPLDGTKEFLSQNGEFTVNVALVEAGRPTLGVIHAPAIDRCYFAKRDGGAWRQEGDAEAQAMAVSGTSAGDPLVIVESRSHPSAALEAYLDGLRIADRIPAGSSLKFCLVADGTADAYPRLGPTMAWDVAAGHCIAEAAGATVLGLRYDTPEWRNGPFVVGPAGLPHPSADGDG